MSYVPMIDTETGDILHGLVIERADLRAIREYGSSPPPPAYIREALSWCTERARSERLQWRQQRGLPPEEAGVIFNSLAPDTNE